MTWLSRSARLVLVAISLAAISWAMLPSAVCADTWYWDGSTLTQNGQSDNTTNTGLNWLNPGGGNWDDNTALSNTLSAWASGDSAVFGTGSGGSGSETVTLGSGITVGNLTFGGGGSGTTTTGINYTITGGTLTLLNSTITTNTTTVINSALAGTGGFLKSGVGTLSLGGASSTLSGTITISQGTLALTSATAFASTANVVIGDANSGASTPTLFANGAAPAFNNLTVGSNVTGATLSINGIWSYNINGTTTLNSPLTILGNGSSFVGPETHLITGSGVASGSDALIFKYGSGTFFWETDNATSAPNTFSGNVHIESGLLTVQTVNVSSNRGQNVIFPTGSMLIIDTGATLGWSTTGYVETVDGLSGGGVIGTPGNLTLTINASNANNQSNRSFSGTLGTLGGALTLSGSGTQTFSGTNITYTGATAVNNGTLRLVDAVNYKSVTTTVASGATFEFNATTTDQIPSTAGNIAIAGAGTFVKSGTGKFDFSNATPVSTVNMSSGGQIDIQGGILEFGFGHNAMGANLGSLNVASNASYYNSDTNFAVDALTGGGHIGNAFNGAQGVTLTVGVSNTQNNATYGVSGNTATFSGVIADHETYNGVTTSNLSVVKTGTGTQILSGTSSYAGSTSFNAGTIQVATLAPNGTTSPLGKGTNGWSFGGGTLEYSGAASPTSAENQSITLNAGGGTIKVDNAAATVTLSGTIGGSGGLLKSGLGTLAIGGSSGYAGTVTISQGTLALTNANSLNSAGTANIVIGDANSGSTTPTYYCNNGGGNAPITNLTVGSGVTGATWSINGIWSCNVLGTTTLNSPLTIVGNGSGTNGPETHVITGSGVASGSDALDFNYGSGTFNWEIDNSTANTFTGNVRVHGGVLTAQNINTVNGVSPATLIASDLIFPTGTMLIIDSGAAFGWGASGYVQTVDGLSGGGTMANPTNLTLTINDNNANNQANRTFSGTLGTLGGSLTLSGTGTQTFSGANITYTNTTNLNNGTLQLTNATGWRSPIAIGASNSPVLQLNAPALTDNWTLYQSISGGSATAALTKAGSGTVTINQPATFGGSLNVTGGKLVLQNPATYAGATVISAGTLQLPTPTSLVNGSALHIDASTLAAGPVTSLTNSANSNTFNISSGSVTVSAGINGHNALVFTGTNAFTSATAYANAGNSMTIFTAASTSAAAANASFAGYLSFTTSSTSAPDFSTTGALAAVTADSGGNNFNPFRNTAAMSGAGAAMPQGTASPFITVQTFDGATSNFTQINSLGAATSASSVGSTGNFSIVNTAIGGRYSGSLQNFWKGDVGEVVVFNSALSASQITQVESYLEAKWFNIGVTSGAVNYLPTTTPMSIALGATFDMAGGSQQVASLSDSGGSGGSVINSVASSSSLLTLTTSGTGTLFSGSIGGVSAGTISLTMSGTGNQILGGTNSYTGPTNITSGTLTVNGSLAAGSSVAIATAGTLAGSGTINGNTTVTGNGVINLTGGTIAGTLGVTGGNWNGTGSVSGLITASSGTFRIGAGANLAANGGLTVTGGTLTGQGAISAGTATLGSGGTIAGPGASAADGSHGTLTLNNLSTSGGGTLSFALSNNPASGNDLIQVNGALTLNGSTTVSIYKINGALATGNYTLMTYGSLPTNPPTLVLAAGAVGSRQMANFDYTSTSGAVLLDITGNPLNLTWVGGTAGSFTNTWNQDVTANTVWNDGSGANYAANGDLLTFDGSSSNPNVSLSGPLTPGSVKVTGGNNYTFSGSGSIGGGTKVTLVGPGSLTLSTTGNTYGGGTAIQGGTLILGATNALPTAGVLTFGLNSSNGTLNLAGNSQTIGGLTVGAGVTSPASQVVTTSSGSATLTYAGSSSVFPGTIQDGGGTMALTVNSGTLDVSSGATSYSGATVINGGSLIVGALPSTNTVSVNGGSFSAASYNGGAALTVVNGASATVSGPNLSLAAVNNAGSVAFTGSTGTITLAGLSGAGTTTFSAGASFPTLSGGNVTVAGPASMTTASGGVANLNGATATIGTISGATVNLGSGDTLSVTSETSGTIAGQGGVSIASGTTTLAGSNSYTGATTFNGGTIQVASLAAVGTNSPLGTGAGGWSFGGGTLEYTGSTSPTTAENQAIALNAGGGTLRVDNAAATVTLSGTMTGSGPLTKSGSGVLAINSASNYAGTATISQGTLALTNVNALGAAANVIIGDANSGATNPTLYCNNPGVNTAFNFNNLTVASGVSGATWSINNFWSCTVNGTTTLNSPLMVLANGSTFTGPETHVITGNGGGSGNDSLVFKYGSGAFLWEIDNTTANTFSGNVHIEAGTLGVQSINIASAFRAQSLIFPAGSMLIVDSGATLNWTQSYVQTVDGLSGGGVIGTPANLTLTINANNASNQSNRSFSGTLATLGGALTLGGTGTQTFSGANITYTNATNLNNGTLKLTNTTAWASPITIGASNAPVLQLDAPSSSDSWLLIPNVSGGSASASVVKSGSGTVTVATAKTYTGATIITGGTLRLQPPSALVAGSVLHVDASGLSAGTTTMLTNSGSNNNMFAASSGSVTVAPGINGHNALVFTGTNAFTSANAYANTGAAMTIFTVASTSGTNVNTSNAGYLSFNVAGTPATADYQSGLAAVTADNGGANFAPFRNSIGMSGNNAPMPQGTANPYITVQTFDGSTSNFTQINSSGVATTAAPVSSSGNFNIAEAAIGGRLLGSNALGAFWKGDVGEILVYNSTLNASQIAQVEGYLTNRWFGIVSGVANYLPVTTPLSIATGATFDMNGGSQQVASLSDYSGGGGSVSNSQSSVPSLLTVTTSGSSSFSGAIQGGGSLGAISFTMSGAGTQILSGANTYTGATTINSGTLRVANTSGSATGWGTVSLIGGTLGGSTGSGGSIGGPVVGSPTLAHTIAPGAGLGSFGTLNLNGGLTTTGQTTLAFNLGTTTSGTGSNGLPIYTFGDRLNVSGGSGLTLNNTVFSFGTNPTTPGDYELIGGSFGSPNLTSVQFQNVPPTLLYRLSSSVDAGGYIDLVVSPSNASLLTLPPSALTLNMHVNVAGTPGVSTVSNGGTPDGHFTPSGAGLAFSLPDGNDVAAGGTTNFNVGWSNVSAAGPQSGQITIVNNDTTGDMATPKTQAVSGALYNLAAANTVGTVYVGAVHAGASLSQPITLSNVAPTDATYSETLTSGGFSSTSSGFTAAGMVTTPIVAGGASNSSGLVVGAGATLSANHQVGTTTLGLTSNEVNSSGLGMTSLTGQTVTIVADVFSGKQQWTPATGGDWAPNGNWSDSMSTAAAGSPGISGFSGDTATFGSSIGSTPATINLNTAPVLAGITFNNASAGYTIAGTNRLTLDTAGSGSASITVAAGNHTISAPVTVAGGLTVSGAGSVTLTGSGNNFTGPILVGNTMAPDTAKLVINAASASTVAVNVTATVAAGATLELDGTASALTDSMDATHRASVQNDGSLVIADGTTMTQATQQVGGIDGAGSVTVADYSSLTADHINQTSLVIGNGSVFTLAPSDMNGNPMGSSLVLANSLTPANSFVASSGSLLGVAGATTSAIGLGLGGAGGGGSVNAVPEPSTLVLAALALLGAVMGGRGFRGRN